MEVKPGYKQTEVGVIPKEWEVKRLGEIAEIQRGASPRPIDSPVWFDDNSPVGWVRISDVTRAGMFLLETTQRLSPLGVKHSRPVANGSLIMSICATVGRPIITKIDVCIHDGFVVFDNLEADQRFIYYVLKWIEPDWSKHGQTGSQMNLNTGLINGTRISHPPLPEQRAIAEALSDVDGLLGGLDRLIAKKRDLKQAAMQQLLTGQTRLPGFHGEWEVKRLGDIVTISKGTQLHSSETNPDGHFPHFNGGISPSSFTNKFNTPANTIAISEGGNSCGYVQLVPQPFWCGGHCYAVVPKWADNRFLFHALKGQQTAIQGLRVGSGLPNVQKTALADFELRLPSENAEQTAISEVLTEMDAELGKLEERREKTRALKQAMMQELLTGRTRLL